MLNRIRRWVGGGGDRASRRSEAAHASAGTATIFRALADALDDVAADWRAAEDSPERTAEPARSRISRQRQAMRSDLSEARALASTVAGRLRTCAETVLHGRPKAAYVEEVLSPVLASAGNGARGSLGHILRRHSYAAAAASRATIATGERHYSVAGLLAGEAVYAGRLAILCDHGVGGPNPAVVFREASEALLLRATALHHAGFERAVADLRTLENANLKRVRCWHCSVDGYLHVESDSPEAGVREHSQPLFGFQRYTLVGPHPGLLGARVCFSCHSCPSCGDDEQVAGWCTICTPAISIAERILGEHPDIGLPDFADLELVREDEGAGRTGARTEPIPIGATIRHEDLLSQAGLAEVARELRTLLDVDYRRVPCPACGSVGWAHVDGHGRVIGVEPCDGCGVCLGCSGSVTDAWCSTCTAAMARHTSTPAETVVTDPEPINKLAQATLATMMQGLMFQMAGFDDALREVRVVVDADLVHIPCPSCGSAGWTHLERNGPAIGTRQCPECGVCLGCGRRESGSGWCSACTPAMARATEALSGRHADR